MEGLVGFSIPPADSASGARRVCREAIVDHSGEAVRGAQLVDLVVPLVEDVFESLALPLHMVELFLKLIYRLLLADHVGAHHAAVMVDKGAVEGVGVGDVRWKCLRLGQDGAFAMSLVGHMLGGIAEGHSRRRPVKMQVVLHVAHLVHKARIPASVSLVLLLELV